MSRAKKTGAGDCFIRFGKLLNNPKTTVEELLQAGCECGLLVGISTQPDPAQSIDLCMDDIAQQEQAQ